jgi:hypothetical protein
MATFVANVSQLPLPEPYLTAPQVVSRVDGAANAVDED